MDFSERFRYPLGNFKEISDEYRDIFEKDGYYDLWYTGAQPYFIGQKYGKSVLVDYDHYKQKIVIYTPFTFSHIGKLKNGNRGPRMAIVQQGPNAMDESTRFGYISTPTYFNESCEKLVFTIGIVKNENGNYVCQLSDASDLDDQPAVIGIPLENLKNLDDIRNVVTEEYAEFSKEYRLRKERDYDEDAYNGYANLPKASAMSEINERLVNFYNFNKNGKFKDVNQYLGQMAHNYIFNGIRHRINVRGGVPADISRSMFFGKGICDIEINDLAKKFLDEHGIHIALWRIQNGEWFELSTKEFSELIANSREKN